MAVDLNAEIKRKRIADSLSDDDTDSESVEEASVTDEPEEPETIDTSEAAAPEEPAPEPSRGKVQTFDDYASQVPPAKAEPLTAESVGVAATPSPTVPVPEPEYAGVGQAPAPDKLTQVERGELVKAPVEPAPAKLDQVERGQLISVPQGAAPKALPATVPVPLAPPGQAAIVPVPNAPPGQAKVVPAELAQGPEGAQQPVPVTSPAPISGIQTFDDYSGGTYQPKQVAAPEQPAVQPGQVPPEPDIDVPAQSYTKGRTQEPNKLILHSSDGTSVQGDINTLTGAEPGHRVSANYYVTKDGRKLHLVAEGDTAWHAGLDRNSGDGNAYTLGIEQQHVDGKEGWPDAQVRATAQLTAGILARHPGMTIDDVIGHSDLAGERKQDPVDYPWDKFRKYVAEAQGGQPAVTAEAPSAQPVTKLKTGFYQDEKPSDFLTGKVTTFATTDDIATGRDNGVGAPHLGGLDTTSVAGVAIPEEVLRAKYGNNYAKWRTARVDVVDPSSGKRLRVPIVDLGPRGDLSAITDMTPSVSKYFGGDKNLAVKLVDNGGPDVQKNPQLFADEQAAIKSGVDSAALAPKHQVIGPQFAVRAQTSEESAAAQKTVQAAIQKQQDVLSKLPETQTSSAALYKRLNEDVPGVTDVMRRNYQQAVKEELTKYAQDYYKEPDPQIAFNRAIGDANIGTVTGEVLSKVIPNFGQADVSIARFLDGLNIDEKRVNQLVDFLHPGATPDARTGFLNDLKNTAPEMRGPLINEYLAQIEKDHPGITATMDPGAIKDSLDRISDPKYQADRQAAIDQKKNWVEQSLRPDPRLQGTPMEFVTQQLAAAPKNLVESLLPAGVRETAFYGELYTAEKDRLRKENPQMSESDLNTKAGWSAFAQMLGPEAISFVIGGGLGRVAAGVENPAARIATRALTNLAVTGAAGGAQVVGGNLISGRPITPGEVGAGMAGGMIQGAPGLVHTFVPHEAARPPVEERPPVTEERPPVEERPPISRAEDAQRRGLIVDVLKKVRDDPGYQPTSEERALIGEWNQREDRDDLFYSASANTEDNRQFEHPKMRIALDRILSEERPPVSPPRADEKPSAPPPVVEPDPEEELNKQNQELLNRYKLQGDLEKRLPIEEKPVPVDLKEDERRAAELGEPPGKVGQPVAEGLDVGLEQGRPNVRVGDVGYPAPGGGENVPQELRPVPRALEAALPPEERAALQPLIDNVAAYPVGTAPAKAAFSHLFETLYKHFEPLFKAGGIKRVDNPNDFDGIAAARYHHDGRLELVLNHPKLESAVRRAMDRGNDPVAYLHGVLQEELIHHAQNLALRDKWISEKAKASGQSFSFYRMRKTRDLVDNWLAARDRAQKRNPDLASEMTQGLHNSMMLYDSDITSPSEAEARFRDIYDKAQKGYLDEGYKLSNMVAEMARQIVQIKGGNLVEPYWKRAMGAAVEWFRNAISGLKSLYSKLGRGQPLAKTELAKMIGAMERKLATLERRAGKGIKAPEPTGTTGEGFVTETPRAPRKTIRERLGEAIARAKLGHSLAFKSGESALLDYKETQPLSIALRREQYLKQAYGRRAQLAQVERAFQSIPKADRPRIVKEWTDYIVAEQNKKPLPTIGADTERLITLAKDSMGGIGELLKENNVHVKDSKGRNRPVNLLGRTFYPWGGISEDMRDIFNNRDGSRAAEFNQIVQDEIAAGNIKTREEFVDKFTHAINGEPHNNDHFSNIERAREMRLPYRFYNFGPDAFLRYAQRATDRLAQVGAYGQKLSNKGKDMFDLSDDAVNASGSLSHEAKQAIISRIASERRAAFERGGQGVLDRIGETGRRGATAAFLSNWGTSFANFVSGASQNMVFGGPGSFLKTAAQFPFEWRKALHDAQDRNILRSNFKDILQDYDLVTNPSWLQKLTQAGLKFGGQNLTENINRVFALQQAKNILREFTRDYGVKDNPITRERNDFIMRRFGGKPDAAAKEARLNQLAAERGVGPLSDEFLSNYVADIHGNYSHAQAPAHIFDSPMGKILLQFQKWGFNTGRMANREYVMPMIRALQSGSMADKGYHVLRNVAYLAAGAGAGTALQSALNAVYRRDPKDPTLAEIGKAISEKDYGTATARFIKRAWGGLILSGFTGLFGNYADVFNNLIGHDPSGRLKDPMHPPAWGLIEPLLAFSKGWAGEGTPLPSETLVRDFLTRIASPTRVGYNMVMGVANSAGLHFSQADHYAAQQERSFARSRISMYEEQNPVLKQKQAQQGTRQVAIQMAGRGPFDPYRDRILNGLSSGNQIEVNSAIREWLQKVPDEQKAAELKRMKQTISANSPLKVGGSTSPDAVLGFLTWAKTNLPEGEVRRIYALASTYAKTALETGMEDKSKPMHDLARLDYDKAKSTSARSSQTGVSGQARAAAQGRVLMQQLIRRQQIAGQLRTNR